MGYPAKTYEKRMAELREKEGQRFGCRMLWPAWWFNEWKLHSVGVAKQGEEVKPVMAKGKRKQPQ